MLSTEERALLDFEGSWWVAGGPKDQLIELLLGLDAESYYDLLLALIEQPEAMVHAPLTVRRVRAVIERAAEPMAGALR